VLILSPAVVFQRFWKSDKRQRWADCHILRSRSSPDLSRLSTSPITIPKIFKRKVQVQMKPKKLEKCIFFTTKMSHFFSIKLVQIRPDPKFW